MALAEDGYRTDAIEQRKRASELAKSAENHYLEYREERRKHGIIADDALKKKAESEKADAQATNTLARLYDKDAEKEGEEAGEFYDSLHDN